MPLSISLKNNASFEVVEALLHLCSTQVLKKEHALPLHLALREKAPYNVFNAIVNGIYERSSSQHEDAGNGLLLHKLLNEKAPVKDVKAYLLYSLVVAWEIDDAVRTPLHIAAVYKTSLEVVESLLNINVSSETSMSKCVDLFGCHPLHYAVGEGASLEFVNALLAAESTAASYEAHGRFPLHISIARRASLHVVNALLRSYYSAAFYDVQGSLPLDRFTLFWRLYRPWIL